MSLARVLVQHLSAGEGWSQHELASLESALQAMVHACRHAWPELDVAPETYLAHVAERLANDQPPSVAVRAIRAEELYLAHACARGDARAMSALERHYGSHIDAVLLGVSPARLSTDDLRQIVRKELFVAEQNRKPRIARYSGRGSLAAWLRVTIRRIALNAVRGFDPAVPGAAQDPFGFARSIEDPELDYLKQTYRSEFREAFLEAVERLSARERTLLRQSIVHALTVRQLGRMYRVHHATVARWIAQARQRLVELTREALLARLEVSERELESIMALIVSRLDVSVARVLSD